MKSLEKHLAEARKKAHDTQKKNGHFLKMNRLSIASRRIKKIKSDAKHNKG